MKNDPGSNVFAPVKQEAAPLRRGISHAIQQAIETGMLAQGSRLIERDLCEKLNVSRTSLRESLRELEAEGLIGRQGKRGLFVTKISRSEAENIYRVRERLEALVVEQIATDPDPAVVARLRLLASQLGQAYSTGEMASILEAKRNFYEALCLGAGNRVVLDILNRINSRVSQLRSASLSSVERRPKSAAEVNDLVEAIASGNPAAAREAALTHVRNAAAAAFGADVLRNQESKGGKGVVNK